MKSYAALCVQPVPWKVACPDEQRRVALADHVLVIREIARIQVHVLGVRRRGDDVEAEGVALGGIKAGVPLLVLAGEGGDGDRLLTGAALAEQRGTLVQVDSPRAVSLGDEGARL